MQDGNFYNCVDCGNEYHLSASVQAHFASKGFPLPKRCKECRVARKERDEARIASGAFHKPTAKQMRKFPHRKRDFGDYNSSDDRWGQR